MLAEAPEITAFITEQPHQLGNRRSMISGSFGTDFAILLELTTKIFYQLPRADQNQVLDAKKRLNRGEIKKPIFLIGDESEKMAATLVRWQKLPRFLLGGKIEHRSSTNILLFRMMQQLGLPPRRADLRWARDTILGFERESLILITNFHLLAPREQQKLLRSLNQLGRVPKVIATDQPMETWTTRARNFVEELEVELANRDLISGAGHK
ncbi:MAG: hypothetical protein AAB685_00890 [Patescibacteria group bacterium]